MVLIDRLLESFDRNCLILDNLSALVTPENSHQKPSEDGMPLYHQLAHVHVVRQSWLVQFSAKHAALLGNTYSQNGEEWVPITDLNEIRHQIKLSAKAVRDAVEEKINEGAEKVGPYDHPVMFLQHMLWHDGYHFALIHLGLRLAGVEITEIWEEKNVWGIWRDEEEY